jgi:hypothetical protein
MNTDKYKGHTPAPWLWYDDGGISSSIRLYHTPLMDSDGDDTEEDLAEIHYGDNCIADARLMADAPLLLARVIRLQSYIAHHEDMRTYARYRYCPECQSIDFFFKFDDEGMECTCDNRDCGNIWRVKI